MNNTNTNSDSIQNSISSMLNNAKDSVINGFSSLTNEAKKLIPVTQQVPTTVKSTGGKRTKKRRKHLKGGNFRAHTPSNGFSANASHISGIRTASFKTVGGKRRRSKCYKHHHHTSKCRRRR